MFIPIKGVWTFPSDVTEQPKGALRTGTNIVVDRESVAQPRPGLPPFGDAFGGSTDRSRKLWWYGSNLVAHYGASSLAYYASNGTKTNISGTFAYPESNYRPPAIVAEGNFYISTSSGTLYTDALGTAFRAAGVPRAINFTAARVGTSGTAVTANTQVAYRHLWVIEDANDNVKRGAPSERVVVTSPAAQTAAIGGVTRVGTTVTVTTPSAHGFTTGHVVTQSGSEANFAAGNKTITGTPTTTTFTYTEAGAAVSSTVELTYTPITTNVTNTIRIPSGITTSHYVEVYRTRHAANVSTDPGDNMQLVANAYPTAVDITNGYITVADAAPDVMRGLALYTNADRDTLGYANETPPIATAMAVFQGSTFYGNARRKQSLTLQLLSIGGTNGLATGETVFFFSSISPPTTMAAVFGVTGSAEDASLGRFEIYTSGTVAQNIENTMRSFVRVLNGYSANTTLYAHYASGPDDAPGLVEVVARSPNTSEFYAAIGDAPYAHTQAWSPAPPSYIVLSTPPSRAGTTVTIDTGLVAHGFTTGQTFELVARTLPADAAFPPGTKTIASTPTSTTFTYTEAGAAGSASTDYAAASLSLGSMSSDNGTPPNTTYYSKDREPEAVPILNNLRSGDATKKTLAYRQVGSTLLQFKEDGLWRIQGDNAFTGFRAVPSNVPVTLLGPELVSGDADQPNDVVYAVTDQGVVAITEFGQPRIISRPIEDLLPKVGSTNLTAYAWVYYHRADRRLLVAVTDFTTSGGNTVPGEIWTYNTITEAWTLWDKEATAAVMDPTNKYLFLGAGTQNKVLRDTRGGTLLDYHDGSEVQTITTITQNSDGTTTLAVDALPSDWTLAVGDAIGQDGEYYTVLSINGTSVTVPGGGPWDTAAATFYRAFTSTIVQSSDGDAPGMRKQFQETSHIFADARFTTGTFTYTTDLVTTSQDVSLTTEVPGVASIFGSEARSPIRVAPLPMGVQKANEINIGFTTTNALGQWKLEGTKLNYRVVSSRVRR